MCKLVGRAIELLTLVLGAGIPVGGWPVSTTPMELRRAGRLAAVVNALFGVVLPIMVPLWLP